MEKVLRKRVNDTNFSLSKRTYRVTRDPNAPKTRWCGICKELVFIGRGDKGEDLWRVHEDGITHCLISGKNDPYWPRECHICNAGPFATRGESRRHFYDSSRHENNVKYYVRPDPALLE